MTDVLVIGGGAGGLLAAMSAKRHGPPGTRVTLVDSWMVGRTGHTAFSNAWTIVAFPDDDLDGITREIVAGNDGIADQLLVRETLADFVRAAARLRNHGNEVRARPGRSICCGGRRAASTSRACMYPDGGGLEFSWLLRRALEDAGVQLIDQLFVTGLLRDDDGRVIGAVGVHSRTGEFHVIKARTTIVATNSIGFRAGFVRDITGTGTLLAYEAGAALRNAEFSYVRPGTPKFYFEGITFRDPGGRPFRQRQGRSLHAPTTSPNGATKPTCRASPARWRPRSARATTRSISTCRPFPSTCATISCRARCGGWTISSTSSAAKPRPTCSARRPTTPMNQMTKMGIRTGPDCRSDVPGLLAAGLAQAGCANHFAGFHIGLCIGNGWIAGRIGDRGPRHGCRAPRLDAGDVQRLYEEAIAAARRRGGGGIRPHPARDSRQSCSPTTSAS